MLNSLIRFSLIQRFMIMAFAVAILFGGQWAFKTIPIDAFPDISPPQVQVIVNAPGMSPTEVEQRITVPIEIEMQGVPMQTIMRSTTKYALSIVTIDFKDEVDIYWARQQVNERLTQVWPDLPENVEGGLAPITTPLGEIFMYRLVSTKHSNRELRRIQDWVIRPKLRTIEGVADVNSLGGEVETFEVVVDPLKLIRFGIGLSQIEEALKKNNRNAGGDRIQKDGEVYLVRTVGKLRGKEDILNVPVAIVDNHPILVSDLAMVRTNSLTRFGGVTADGQGEVVTGLVLLAKGANSRETVSRIKFKFEEVNKALPEGLSIKVFYDRSNLVNAATSTVTNALIQAVVLVFVVLIFMLGSLRSAIVVSLNLPLSVFITFLLMRYFDISANLMSLGGIAIAIGILIDSAIVVVENIHSYLAHAPVGVSRRHLIFRSVTEVAPPVVAGVVIIIVVFFPLFSMTGLEGKMFRPLAQTIAFAMGGSLLLALTVVPVLASFLMKGTGKGDGFLLAWTKDTYRPFLNFCLKFKMISLGASLLILLSTLSLFFFVGAEFMPAMDEGDTVILMEKRAGMTLKESLDSDVKYQKALMEIPQVTGVVSRTGADELRLDPMDLFQTDNFLQTTDRSKWDITLDEFHAKIREKLDQFGDVDYAFSMPIDMRVSEMITGVRSSLAVKVFGDSIEVLENISKEIETRLKEIPGAVDVIRSEVTGQKYLQIEILNDAVSEYGISAEDINRLIETAVGGSLVTEVIQDSKRVGVLVRFDQKDREDMKAISSLLVETPHGNKIKLNVLAKIYETDGPFQISRELGKRLVVIQSNVEGMDIVQFVEKVKDKLKDLKIPEGHFITFGGQFENQQRASQRLAVVVPISLFLIFILLFATFRTLRHSFLILLNIPFALAGGVLALYLTGFYFSVPASIGFIALFGIAVMNGVVMISYFNQLKDQGHNVGQAVTIGSEKRLRPVLMTATITILGLIPLLLATGPGSELQRPLAIVVIGGTVTSTILTLLILPTVYQMVEDYFVKRGMA